MKITEPSAEILQGALAGELRAIDRLLLDLQPGVFNLALRMLGNRDDAADATQEILLRVITHLASFRGEARLATWVFRIARNHLLNAATRSRESPEISFASLSEDLAAGLALGERLLGSQDGVPLTPEDKLQARQVALGCTQGMLMALDREHRLAYILDLLFGLDSKDAAEVLGISSDAYRQRVSRARARLDGFFASTCGLANAQAPCRCEKQLPAVRHVQLQARGSPKPASLVAQSAQEQQHVERALASLERLGNAAEVLRAHPDYAAPQAQIAAIRSVLGAEGYLGGPGLAPH